MSRKSKRLNQWIVGSAGALATAAVVSSGLCADASDPLLDMLIKKGLLTEQEARDIKAEAQTNAVPSAASKWKLSSSLKNIGLYGDVRFRYEYRGADNPQNPVLSSRETYFKERFRYALRAGIQGEIYDNFNYGVRIETSTNPRSTWVTFGDDSNPTPSAKNSDGIGVGQIYLGWKPTDWFELTVGKMPMPLYTTPMVWDTDINPEGAFEKFKYSIKNVDLFAGFGQFIYQDTSVDVSIPSSDTWMFAWQVGANVKLDERSSFRIAPLVYTYAGRGSANQLNLPFVGQGFGGTNALSGAGFNENGINDLLVVEVPAEYNLKLGAYHARVFGDYAYNVNGNTRARKAFAAGSLQGDFPASVTGPVTGQNTAYQIGAGFSTEGPARKHSWETRVYWQHVEQYALDVNLLDSDLFEGRANLEGIAAAISYNFTDAISGTIRYGYARRINNSLGTGGNNPDLPILNPVLNYNLVQLDLMWKF